MECPNNNNDQQGSVSSRSSTEMFQAMRETTSGETVTGYRYTNGHANPAFEETDVSNDTGHVTAKYQVGMYVQGKVEVPEDMIDGLNNDARKSGRWKSSKSGTIFISTHL